MRFTDPAFEREYRALCRSKIPERGSAGEVAEVVWVGLEIPLEMIVSSEGTFGNMFRKLSAGDLMRLDEQV